MTQIEHSFEKIDEIFAHRLEQEKTGIFWLLIYLFKISREGHLCLYFDKQKQEYGPKKELLFYQGKAIDKELLFEAIVDLKKKSYCLFNPANIDEELAQSILKPIVLIESHSISLLYLQRNYLFEKEIFKRLHLLNQEHESFDEKAIENRLKEFSMLLKEQKKAVTQALLHPLFMITGGPGTGKTYTAAIIIEVFVSLFIQKTKKQPKIALAAPTGKAVGALKKSLKKVFNRLKTEKLEAKTLHSLLQKKELIDADFVLVDEASMIDAKMMKKLVQSVAIGSHLLFLGDPNQLPPVESGALFVDLVQSKCYPTASLTTCMRSDRRALIDAAQAIYRGDINTVLHSFENSCDLKLSNIEEPKQLISLCQDFFNYNDRLDDQYLLENLNRFVLLTPIRKGPFGVDQLNEMFYHQFSSGKERFIAPIIVTKNDYKTALSNGDMGLLIKTSSSSHIQKGDYMIFSGEDGVIKVPALFISSWEYGFALSVHKSQGSEFDQVFVLVPQGAEVFGRELLYTAFTRAKKKVTLLGEKKRVHQLIKNREKRISSLTHG